jgi:hypothetical protein
VKSRYYHWVILTLSQPENEMIRIILAVIGIAFCIMSSLTAPAGAVPLQVPATVDFQGRMPGGVFPGGPESSSISIMYEPAASLYSSGTPGQVPFI